MLQRYKSNYMKLTLTRIINGKLFNIAAFNLLWLGCVVGQNKFLWLITPILTLYLWFLISNKLTSFLSIALPATLGIFADMVLTLAGIFQFQNTFLIIPLWLVVLWIGFSSTLSQSLAFLGKNKWITAFAGAVAFPFNYGVGERLGAVSFGNTYLVSVLTMSLLWALLFPLCFYISEVMLKTTQQGDRNATA